MKDYPPLNNSVLKVFWHFGSENAGIKKTKFRTVKMLLPIFVVSVAAYDDTKIKDLEDDKLQNWVSFQY